MELDAETREDVVERLAQLLREDVRNELGGISKFILLDTGTVAQCVGQTKAWVRSSLNVRRISARTSGVILGDLKKHLDECPQSKPEKSPSPASS